MFCLFSDVKKDDFDKIVGIIRLSDLPQTVDDPSSILALQESRAHTFMSGVGPGPSATERILSSRSPEARTVFICCEDRSSRQNFMLEVCNH